jgi:hypothetical protein
VFGESPNHGPQLCYQGRPTTQSKVARNFSCSRFFQNVVFGGMENFFKWYGYQVAKYPYFAIFGCLIFATLCGLGLLNFREETDQIELWVPKNSAFYSNIQWLNKNFPSDNRFQQYMLVTTDDSDILTPDNLKLLNRLRNNITNLT